MIAAVFFLASLSGTPRSEQHRSLRPTVHPLARGEPAPDPHPASGPGRSLRGLFYLSFTVALAFRRGLALLAAAFIGLVALHPLIPPSAFVLVFWSDPIILEFLAGIALAGAYLRGLRLALWASLLCAALAPIVYIGTQFADLGCSTRSPIWVCRRSCCPHADNSPREPSRMGLCKGPSVRRPSPTALSVLSSPSRGLHRCAGPASRHRARHGWRDLAVAFARCVSIRRATNTDFLQEGRDWSPLRLPRRVHVCMGPGAPNVWSPTLNVAWDVPVPLADVDLEAALPRDDTWLWLRALLVSQKSTKRSASVNARSNT